MIKMMYAFYVFLLIGCAYFVCTYSRDTNISSPEFFRITSSCQLIGTDFSERDGGYGCWLFFSKKKITWECTEKDMIEDKDKSSYYFNPKDIVVGNINKIIPWWNFYHKITKDDIISFSLFYLTKKSKSGKIIFIETKHGYYLWIFEHHR